MIKHMVWIVLYTIVFATLVMVKHFWGFEQAVITGLAWTIADIEARRL